MKTTSAIAFLLFLAPSAFCQSPKQSCPVSFPLIDPAGIDTPGPFGGGDPWGLDLVVDLQNTAAKDITAVKIGANFIDAVGDKHESYENYLGDERVKVGKKHRFAWHDGVYISQLGQSANVEIWLIKAVYSDGSVWNDDGSRSCGAHTFTVHKGKK